MVELVLDPYRDVDWGNLADPTGSGEPCKAEVHNHPEKWEKPHRVIDLYAGDGADDDGDTLPATEAYTVFAVGDSGTEPMRWPWTELRDGEPRDPSRVRGGQGVISFPAMETGQGGAEHVTSLFSTIQNDDLDASTRKGLVKEIAERDRFHKPSEAGGLSLVAHPARYSSNPVTDWRRYEPDFADENLEGRLMGLEVLNKNSSPRVREIDQPLQDVKLWDKLLTAFMPQRPIWAFGVDDPFRFVIGDDIDVRWTYLLLDDETFDPSSQDESRQAAAQAVRQGALIAAQRSKWDNGSLEPGSMPIVEDISVDREAQQIRIRAQGHEEVRWVSRGKQVATGASLSYDGSHIPYARAEIHGSEGVLLTQPWGLAGERPVASLGDATLGDVTWGD